MKKFNEMTIENVINVINNSKELREMLDNYIQEVEMDNIDDRLNCFKYNCIDYSIGFYSPSYFNIKDEDSYECFVEGVRKSCSMYGLTTNTESLLNMVEKLQYTNLYNYWCKQLCEAYYNTEIKDVLSWVEDVSYELYCGTVGEKAADYIEDFVMNIIGEYLWDEEEQTYYTPCRISA